MKITTIVRATAAAAVAALCLSPGQEPGAWAQTQPAAATDTVLEADFALALTARGAWSPGPRKLTRGGLLTPQNARKPVSISAEGRWAGE